MSIDAAIVHERLRLMRALLADLDQVGEVTAERLERERIVRHAVERITTQLVDLADLYRQYVTEVAKHVASATS